jgi:magnesium-transporting ATPase (P-type)
MALFNRAIYVLARFDRYLLMVHLSTTAQRLVQPITWHALEIEKVLALDHADIESGLIFLGLQGMIDPPSESATKAVQACQQGGIQVKMIIGDHAITAQAIARRMGINKNGAVLAFTGAELAHMDKNSPMSFSTLHR